MSYAQLGEWQDWDSEDYLNFLEEFYTIQLDLARAIAIKYPDDFVIAVFDKLATPAVYLKAEYQKWKDKRTSKGAIPGRQPKPMPTNVPQRRTEVEDRWKVSPKNATILWCSERDATGEELAIAKSKDSSIWYMEAREGYQYGAIFKKVKT